MSATEDIDADGDLILIVGGEHDPQEEKHFKVSRVAMRLASPVWKAMLTGRFAEATAKEASFKADDPDGMRILLLLAHLQHARLPSQLPLATVGHLAKLCDKYELLQFAKEKVLYWLEAHTRPVTNVLPFLSSDDKVVERFVRYNWPWIWIGWTFKDKKVFKAAMKDLAHYLTPAHLKIIPELPPGCQDLLETQSLYSKTKLVRMIYDVLRSDTCDEDCKDGVLLIITHEKCSLLRLGVAAKLMKATSLPFDADVDELGEEKAGDVMMGIKELSKLCETIWASIKDDLDFGGWDHDYCFFSFKYLKDSLETQMLITAREIDTHFAEHFEKEETKSTKVVKSNARLPQWHLLTDELD